VAVCCQIQEFRCHNIPCQEVFAGTLPNHPCWFTEPVAPDACGLFETPGCVECFEEDDCAENEQCIFPPDRGLFGVCTGPTPTRTGTGTRTATPTPTMGPCRGDCDGDGTVGVNEIVRAVGIALGQTSVDACPDADVDGNGAVSVNELVAAVAAALNGCAG